MNLYSIKVFQFLSVNVLHMKRYEAILSDACKHYKNHILIIIHIQTSAVKLSFILLLIQTMMYWLGCTCDFFHLHSISHVNHYHHMVRKITTFWLSLHFQYQRVHNSIWKLGWYKTFTHIQIWHKTTLKKYNINFGKSDMMYRISKNEKLI